VRVLGGFVARMGRETAKKQRIDWAFRLHLFEGCGVKRNHFFAGNVSVGKFLVLSDWRLPAGKELESIVDYQRP
jgi:hypothetical protein